MAIGSGTHRIGPSRGWFAVAVAVAGLGLVAGIVAAVLNVKSAAKTAPDWIVASDNGASHTVHLLGDRSYQVYLPREEIGSTKCRIGGATTATVKPALDDAAARALESYDSGSVTWQPGYQIDVSRSGDYPISCDGTKFTVADLDQTTAAQVRTFLTAAAEVVGLSGIGIVLGVAITIIVKVRRRRPISRL